MRVTTMDEPAARAVCSWRYESPYHVYDHPDYELAAAQRWAIADPSARADQFRVVMHGDELVGFSRLFRRDGRTLLGAGMAPGLTGRGRGARFLSVVLADVDARTAEPVELEVRTFNARAIAAYRRRGFVEVGRRSIVVPSGATEVVVMRRDG